MIRQFKIWNEKFKELEGYLFFDTETEQFSMRALDNYSGKHPDIFFRAMNDRGIVDVPQYLVDMWVTGRVVPPNRQGIEGILADIGMREYNVFDLLVYGNGRCQMDFSCIIEITDESKS